MYIYLYICIYIYIIHAYLCSKVYHVHRAVAAMEARKKHRIESIRKVSVCTHTYTHIHRDESVRLCVYTHTHAHTF